MGIIPTVVIVVTRFTRVIVKTKKIETNKKRKQYIDECCAVLLLYTYLFMYVCMYVSTHTPMKRLLFYDTKFILSLLRARVRRDYYTLLYLLPLLLFVF